MTVLPVQAAVVEDLGGGTAIALPLIPSPNTSGLAVADDATDDGRDWLRDTLASNVDLTDCRRFVVITFDIRHQEVKRHRALSTGDPVNFSIEKVYHIDNRIRIFPLTIG